MKISKSKRNRKTPKYPFNFDSIKNSIWLHVVNGIQSYSHNLNKKLLSGFWKKAHFTSPPLRKFPNPNVTEKPQKFNLILIQSKIPFGCM